MKTVVFLGTKPIGYESLAYLIDQQAQLDYKIIAVGTKVRKEFDTTKDIAALAKQHNIAVLADEDSIPECDIIYSVQYHKILKTEAIAQAKQIAVNLHLAPLPDYRGCNQFSFAIFHGAKTFGVTIHQIDTGVDCGPILFEDRFPMDENWWVKDLFEISTSKGLALLKNTLEKIVKEEYSPQDQTPLIASRGLNIHYRKDIEKLKEINLNEDAKKIATKIKATYMPGFEPPYCMINGEKIYFTKKEAE